MLQKQMKQAYNFNSLFKEIINQTNKTPLLVTGPSGVGKSTFVDKLIKQSYPNTFKQTVNYTSRNPRPQESHGIDYYFITAQDFINKIQQGQFIEHTNHYKTYYGSCKNEVLKIIKEEGKIPVFVIDIKGAIKIIESIQDVNRIFIKPPCIETLRARLIARGTESADKVELRVQKAYEELDMIEKSNYYKKENIILNDNIDNSYNNFLNRIEQIYDLKNQKQQNNNKNQSMIDFANFRVQPIAY